MPIPSDSANRTQEIGNADTGPFTLLITPQERTQFEAVAAVRGNKIGPTLRWVFRQWINADMPGLSDPERSELAGLLDKEGAA